MLDKKLQLKDGQTIAVLGEHAAVNLTSRLVDADEADAVLLFITNEAQLRKNLRFLKTSAAKGTLTWIAYPKAKKLDTDVNRDIIRQIANENELDPVRQIAIDDTWSALRLKRYAI
jgi:hypothetical protein